MFTPDGLGQEGNVQIHCLSNPLSVHLSNCLCVSIKDNYYSSGQAKYSFTVDAFLCPTMNLKSLFILSWLWQFGISSGISNSRSLVDPLSSLQRSLHICHDISWLSFILVARYVAGVAIYRLSVFYLAGFHWLEIIDRHLKLHGIFKVNTMVFTNTKIIST